MAIIILLLESTHPSSYMGSLPRGGEGGPARDGGVTTTGRGRVGISPEHFSTQGQAQVPGPYSSAPPQPPIASSCFHSSCLSHPQPCTPPCIAPLHCPPASALSLSSIPCLAWRVQEELRHGLDREGEALSGPQITPHSIA